MVEMTWVADALKIGNILITLVYYGTAALLIYVAMSWRTPIWQKTVAVSVVVTAFAYLPVSGYLKYRDKQAYSRTAWERFNRYCADKAGEKVHRRAHDVASVVVMRPRTEKVIDHDSDQFWKGDPYGGGHVGQTELKSLLWQIKDDSVPNDVRRGFQFVETIEKLPDGREQVYEHRLAPSFGVDSDPALESKLVSKRQSRFGFTWDDISTNDDRKYWIAGSALRVIDLESNEIIAERIGYMIDPGFGNRSGGRSPWLIAVSSSCPKLVRGQERYATRTLVIRVLTPVAGEK